MKAINTIEDLEIFVKSNSYCNALITAELNEKMGKAFYRKKNATEKDNDYTFKTQEISNLMLKKSIGIEVKSE